MLKSKVKVGAITNLTDARYFAAREVEWLGFDCSIGSETYVSPQQILAIREWVDGVKITGEFNIEPLETIQAAIAELQLDAVQLGMAAATDTIRQLTGSLPVIREIVPDYYHSDEDLQEQFAQTPAGISYFVLNLEKNGFTWADLKAGSPFSLPVIQQLCEQYPVLLALNYQPQEITEILDTLPLAGLHLSGGAEEKVGFKSFDDLDALLDLLEVE
ncbi:MAG: hypothetical protein R2824_16575 [Saprospiraceae bacterium]|nr:hypothetical protein [Lewinella sp.]